MSRGRDPSNRSAEMRDVASWLAERLGRSED
jgi:hypothetical protein